jgi:hypothetical protein
MTFELHRLLQECSWGIKQGLATVPCNTENLEVIGLVCVFLEVFLSALYFRVTYCTHLQSLCFIQACALCSWVALGGSWEHTALAWVGYMLWSWGNTLPCRVYYSEFLDFFPVWGEHSVNHGWLCSVEDVCEMCGDRLLLHQSTWGLAQEWTPPRQYAQGLQISTKLQKWTSGTTLLFIHSSNTQCIVYNSHSSFLLLYTLPHLHHQFFALFIHTHTHTSTNSSTSSHFCPVTH